MNYKTEVYPLRRSDTALPSALRSALELRKLENERKDAR